MNDPASKYFKCTDRERAIFEAGIKLGAISVFLVTGAGNIINDISDLNTDKINHPDRPLPSGKITRQSALTASIIIFIIAIIVSSFISYRISLIVFIAEMLLVSYEFKTKKTWTDRKFYHKPPDRHDFFIWWCNNRFIYYI